ncbi:hypothetical protein HHK36_016066 [Tetracentron sinense]|uniref:Uncharacterized protein n=1 Tax=Tetracentron sinense TaxID=13715 RepID=A0A835DEC9_TETSI|nr:hypothetical protein HHK36_016066 [Tetracentron sinense]
MRKNTICSSFTPNYSFRNFPISPFPTSGSSHHAYVSKAAQYYELSIEEEAERKVGCLLKLIFAGTASVIAYQFFSLHGYAARFHEIIYCNSPCHSCKSMIPGLKEWEHLDYLILQLMIFSIYVV